MAEGPRTPGSGGWFCNGLWWVALPVVAAITGIPLILTGTPNVPFRDLAINCLIVAALGEPISYGIWRLAIHPECKARG